jgi:hypothetical protein
VGTIAVVPIDDESSRFGPVVGRQFCNRPDDLPALIPFSFGHSVVRYRLMDVDVVVRRALVYALTTVATHDDRSCGVGARFLAVGNNLSATEITLRALIAIVAMGRLSC